MYINIKNIKREFIYKALANFPLLRGILINPRISRTLLYILPTIKAFYVLIKVKEITFFLILYSIVIHCYAANDCSKLKQIFTNLIIFIDILSIIKKKKKRQ